MKDYTCCLCKYLTYIGRYSIFQVFEVVEPVCLPTFFHKPNPVYILCLVLSEGGYWLPCIIRAICCTTLSGSLGEVIWTVTKQVWQCFSNIRPTKILTNSYKILINDMNEKATEMPSVLLFNTYHLYLLDFFLLNK